MLQLGRISQIMNEFIRMLASMWQDGCLLLVCLREKHEKQVAELTEGFYRYGEAGTS